MLNKIATACFLFSVCYVSGAMAGEDKVSHDHGIWKAVVPKATHGEFDSLDVIGLISGALIKADCSINWVNPDTGKRYCFSSGTSLQWFLDRPNTYIQKAKDAWDKRKPEEHKP